MRFLANVHIRKVINYFEENKKITDLRLLYSSNTVQGNSSIRVCSPPNTLLLNFGSFIRQNSRVGKRFDNTVEPSSVSGAAVTGVAVTGVAVSGVAVSGVAVTGVTVTVASVVVTLDNWSLQHT